MQFIGRLVDFTSETFDDGDEEEDEEEDEDEDEEDECEDQEAQHQHPEEENVRNNHHQQQQQHVHRPERNAADRYHNRVVEVAGNDGDRDTDDVDVEDEDEEEQKNRYTDEFLVDDELNYTASCSSNDDYLLAAPELPAFFPSSGFQIDEDCTVTKVIPGSTPDLFGVEVGDTILDVNGLGVSEQLIHQTCSGHPGTRCALTMRKQHDDLVQKVVIIWLPCPEKTASIGLMIDDRFAVTKVVPGSSASSASIRVGDKVEEIDEVPTQTLDAAAVRLKFKGISGSVVSIKVNRDNGDVIEAVLRRKQYGSLDYLGFVLNNKCKVQSVHPDGPAALSKSINVGDVIVAADGEPLTTETIGEHLAGEAGTSVVLSIRCSATKTIKTVTLTRKSDFIPEKKSVLDSNQLQLLLRSPPSVPSPNIDDRNSSRWPARTNPSLARYRKIQHLLDGESLDLEALRNLCWSGAPFPSRAKIWKLLLGYLPCMTSRRTAALTRMRQEYHFLAQNLMAMESRGEYEEKQWHQIQIDLVRIYPNKPLFHQPQIRELLQRLLYTWALTHPATGYVQGIDSITAPFVYAFLSEELGGGCLIWDDVDANIEPKLLTDVEADVFHCVSRLLDTVQDNYFFGQVGIQKKIFELRRLMLKVDRALCDKLESCGIDFMQFAWRWVNCLLVREFKVNCILRLLDTYIAEGERFSSFFVYVCAAFLMQFSKQLMRAEDDEVLILLMKLPTDDWEDEEMSVMFGAAHQLRAMYSRSLAHLECA